MELSASYYQYSMHGCKLGNCCVILVQSEDLKFSHPEARRLDLSVMFRDHRSIFLSLPSIASDVVLLYPA